MRLITAIVIVMLLVVPAHAGIKIIRLCTVFDDYGIKFENDPNWTERCLLNGKIFWPEDFQPDDDKEKDDEKEKTAL